MAISVPSPPECVVRHQRALSGRGPPRTPAWWGMVEIGVSIASEQGRVIVDVAQFDQRDPRSVLIFLPGTTYQSSMAT